MWFGRWLKPVKRALLAFLVTFLGFGLFCVLTQDIQIFPMTVPALLGLAASPAPDFVEVTTVKTSDGESIPVWRVVAKGERRGVVLHLHGNAQSLSAGVALQRHLASQGITSFAFDYRGTGSSSGWPSEDGIYRDVDAVMEFVGRREGMALSDVVPLGVSIGTGPAAYAAKKYGARSVALVSPYVSLGILVEEMPLYGLLRPFLKYEFPTLELLRSSPRTRVLISHGRRDGTIPYSHAQRLVQQLAGQVDVRLFTFDTLGHNNILGPALERMLPELFSGAAN
jgi:pimeloyl-ACP methyl ester carboxylesterase